MLTWYVDHVLSEHMRTDTALVGAAVLLRSVEDDQSMLRCLHVLSRVALHGNPVVIVVPLPVSKIPGVDFSNHVYA